jgi:hypothetical protein
MGVVQLGSNQHSHKDNQVDMYLQDEFYKHDPRIVKQLEKLYKKILPIAEEMNIELRMVEDCNQTTIMFVPLVEIIEEKQLTFL